MKLSEFELARCFCVDKCSEASIQLHVFADASDMGFGAVCYARYSFPDGTIKVSFVMARNRVAHLKQLIPRLQLQAAVLSVRLHCLVKQELTVTVKRTIVWSDSKTLLQYIANESRRFHTFVVNRVSEIHDTTDPTQWRHVPGHWNPADDCTRGLRAADLDKRCRWLNGPAFLSESEEHWPQDTFIGPLRENDDEEVKNTKWSGHASVTDPRAYFPDPEKFSSWTRFRRVLAWICRFVQNCKRKAGDRILLSLTAAEICNAELIAVRKSQRDSFSLDFEALKANKRLPVKSRLSALRPYIDEAECLRVGGRLRKAPVPEETRHPLILDPKHEITRLIVMHHHLRLYCTSNKHVLNELRQKYWILKGLATVQKISSCRRLRAKPEPPVMSWPICPIRDWVIQQPPFTNTGVDYFGPMLVRHGRKTEKRYGVLFTCLTTRAVHLEIAHSLMAIRRMVARRG